jgi:predicted RNase H-like HicB family nuclease
MSLNQAADTILMPYGETIAEVLDRFDNRSKLHLEDLIQDGYVYTAEKISDSPLT